MKKSRQRRNNTTLGLFFGESAGPQTVEDNIERISGTWHKKFEPILDLCKFCAEADENLDGTEKKELIERLPFNRTSFVKLAKIGRDQRLQKPEIRALLPASQGILADLAGLNDAELVRAVDEKVLHPKMKRKELAQWVKNRRGRVGENKAQAIRLPKGVHYAIRLPDMTEEAAAEFEQRLDELCAERGAELIYPPSRYNSRDEDRRWRRAQKYMRQEVRKLIRTMKSEYRNRNEKWPYYPEETQIDDGADMRRLEEILDVVGRPDAFEKIRNKALREEGL